MSCIICDRNANISNRWEVRIDSVAIARATILSLALQLLLPQSFGPMGSNASYLFSNIISRDCNPGLFRTPWMVSTGPSCLNLLCREFCSTPHDDMSCVCVCLCGRSLCGYLVLWLWSLSFTVDSIFPTPLVQWRHLERRFRSNPRQ